MQTYSQLGESTVAEPHRVCPKLCSVALAGTLRWARCDCWLSDGLLPWTAQLPCKILGPDCGPGCDSLPVVHTQPCCAQQLHRLSSSEVSRSSERSDALAAGAQLGRLLRQAAEVWGRNDSLSWPQATQAAQHWWHLRPEQQALQQQASPSCQAPVALSDPQLLS